LATQLKNSRLGRNSSADTFHFGRNTSTIGTDTTTQMNLLTLQTTDRESQMQNFSRFDGGDTTTGRNLSGGYTTGRSGIPSLLPQGIGNNSNHQILHTEEERKEDQTQVDDTIKDLDFPNMLNLKDLSPSSKVIREIGSEINTPQNDMILPINDKIKNTNLITQEELIARLNSSSRSIINPQKDKMRKVQSVQVIPKPMYINLNNPVAILGDEPATFMDGKMEDNPALKESLSEIKSSDMSQTHEQKCLVCFDKEPDAVYMECGHGGFLTYLYIHFKGFVMTVHLKFGKRQMNVIYVEK
jgi:hypothetical protein